MGKVVDSVSIKSSFLYTQAVKVTYSLLRSGRDARRCDTGMLNHYPNGTGQ